MAKSLGADYQSKQKSFDEELLQVQILKSQFATRFTM